MTTVNIHEAKTHLSKLLRRAHGGEEITIAKAGKPYARLVPLKDPERRKGGRYADHVPDSFYRDLPAEELDAWEK